MEPEDLIRQMFESSDDIALKLNAAHVQAELIEKLQYWFEHTQCWKVRHVIVAMLYPLYKKFSDLQRVLPHMNWKQYVRARDLLALESHSDDPLSVLFQKELVHHRLTLTDLQIDSLLRFFLQRMRLDAARATYRGSRS
jgi:hypothetical protein